MEIHFLHFARNSSPATFATRPKSMPDPLVTWTPTRRPDSLPAHSSLFTRVLPLFAMKRIFSLLLLLFAVTLRAQEADSNGKITLTVILRHDQSMTVDEINDHLEKTGFRKNFPPEGVEILSYNIVMGIGHIITLRFPPEKLREVNLAFEHGVWGAFRTEFYPTYDYLKVFYELKQKAASGAPTPAEKEPENEKKPDDSAKPSPTKRPHRKSNQ
jgi:hypothetical protein